MLKKILPIWFKNRVNTFRLRGKNVTCNLCEKQFITLMPSGIPLRANSICPSCGSFERTRIYWQYLNQLPGFFQSKKVVLHTAPESILYNLFSKNKNFEYHPIDKFEDGYDYPSKTVHMDIQDLKFPDNHFDFILSSHVLEHVLDDRKAMKEFYRVLSPKGFAILQVPMDINRESTYEDETIVSPEKRKIAFGQYDHLRIYGMDYKSILENVGFIVEINNYSLEMSADDRFRVGFGSGEALYIVRKPNKS